MSCIDLLVYSQCPNSPMSKSLINPRPSTDISETCTLTYRPSGTSLLTSTDGPVLATLHRDGPNSVFVTVETDWRNLVRTEDAPEVEEILKDLATRCISEPAALWRQFLGANWGLIVLGQVTSSVAEQSADFELDAREVAF